MIGRTNAVTSGDNIIITEIRQEMTIATDVTIELVEE